MKHSVRLLAATVALATASVASQADNLTEIYELSLRNDPQIRASEATYRAGLESEKLGLSGLLPQINANAGYQTSEAKSKGDIPLGSVGNIPNDSKTKADANTWGVSLDQRIFDMPAWFSFKQGKQLTRQAEAQFGADQQDLIVRVAEAYFDVLRSLDNLNASRAQEAANKRQLEQTQQRFDVGLIAITDVHEARAGYDLAVATRLADEGSLGVSLEKLSILTGQRHDNIWLLKDDYPVVNPDPMEVNDWLDFAMNNNFSIRASAYGRDASKEFAEASKAEHYPKLSARLGYDDNRTSNDRDDNINNVSSSFDDNRATSSVSLNLTVPLYSGGFISASRRQAYEQYNTAVENYAGVVRTTLQATRAFHIQVTTDVARTRARRLSITSSQSALDATQAGYEVGTRNIVDVLNVQQTLFSAIRDYANARYDYVIDMLKLKQQAGTLSPEDIYNLNKWLEAPAAPTLSNTTFAPVN